MTLTRFYSLHVAVLPALTVMLLGAHVALFLKLGVTPPASADLRKVDRFFPKQVGLDLLVGLLILVGLFALAAREHGAPLDAPADPASDYPARPEWYFLSLFEMLKYFKGSLEPVGAVGIPLLVGGYLFALPFLDRRPGASLKARLPLLAPLALVLLGAFALTAKSMAADAKDEAFHHAREVASQRAERAIALFREGVPPEPLSCCATTSRRGEDLPTQCASCHASRSRPAREADRARPHRMHEEVGDRAARNRRGPPSARRRSRAACLGRAPPADPRRRSCSRR
jgi:ubiquinol-cytochrome c reductase cytochrome b subunit